MKKTNVVVSRRELLKNAVGALLAAPVAGIALSSFAAEKKAAAAKAPAKAAEAAKPAGFKLVDPATDPVAKALKYVHAGPDAAKHCKTCIQYTPQGMAVDGKTQVGKCNMIAGGSVAEIGTCMSWAKKA